MISTVSIFGSVFAYLSEIGRPNDVFFLNAVSRPRPLSYYHHILADSFASSTFQGMALLAAGVLLFVRFPRTVVASPGSV